MPLPHLLPLDTQHVPHRAPHPGARPRRAPSRTAPWLLALLAAAALPALAQTKPATKTLPRPAAIPPAGGEQMAAASLAHFGDYECEFGEKVHVDLNRRFDGYLDVKHRNRIWIMKPVLSSTGALRLEDVRGRMLMLQIAEKSMVMDTQIGQRVVDNCVHAKHREAIAARQAASAAEAAGSAAAAASAPAPTASTPR